MTSMRKLKFVLVAVVVIVALNVLKNGIVQSVIAGGVSHATHLPVHIGSTNFSFLASSIRLKNLRVENPRGFPERLLADVPEIAIDFEPRDLLQGKAHFEEVKLDLREIVVVKGKDGRLNVDAVKPSKEQREAEKAKAREKAKPKGRAPKLQIDKLTLSIGRVIYRDHSAGGKPSEQVFDINIKDRTYTNIDNPSVVVSLIMFEALTRTSIARLAGLDIDVFKDGAIGALAGGLGLVGDAAQGFEEQAKGLLNLFD